MARMIPPVVPGDVTSFGEAEIFRRLRDDPATQDWIVLHSLGIAEHEERVAGEVDFVVIIPGLGVLCLEIKGCSAANLRRENGLWFYGPKGAGEARSPFQQAAQGMHAIRRKLRERLPAFPRIQFSSGVIFPFAPFRERSAEWSSWESIDSHTFRSAPISTLLESLMLAAREHLLSAPQAPILDPDRPNVEECRLIAHALRGDFEIRMDPKARAAALDAELRRYTDEQLDALDAMAHNDRTIFSGPAGTGKTVLAIEAARRGQASGRRVLFVCFNALLGRWLAEQTSDLAPGVVTKTLHAYMLAVSGLGKPPSEAGGTFWSQELPERACDRLLEACGDDSTWLFDELIIDEAQDLLRRPYLDFLDLSLRGGLGAGRWRMFGDFEKQAIYGAEIGLEEFRQERSGKAPIFELRDNCRNTPSIAEYVHLLAGLDPRYRRVRRPDDGIKPRLRYYKDRSDQIEQLIRVLSDLDRDGFRGSDIVILSPRGEGKCAAAEVATSPWRDRLRSLGHPAPGHIKYGTIHAFKGLEAPAILVTDIEAVSGAEAQALFYVGITRSTQRLIVLAHEPVRGELLKVLVGE